jgi:signal transduction histidine kinase
VFLLVLAAATALEVVVSVAVLRPFAAQRARERAELALDRAARQIAALPDPYDLSELGRVLRANRLDDPGAFLILSAWDGRLVADRALATGLRDRLIDLLAGAGLADSAAARRAWAPGPLSPPPGADGPLPEARDLRFEVLGHRAVVIEGGRFGDVAAIGSALRLSPWALPESRALLLFLPFAVLASGVAGLLMVRIVVRRLDALDQAAARVTGGDLSVRLEARAGDEIGRLEERFNLMTARLAAARTEVERNDEQRRRLLADVSHELATPLTSIRGYVETLLDPGVPKTSEEHAAYLADVLDEAKRLDLLVSELLELTRLEAGAQPLEPVRLDWTALCLNVTRRLAPQFARSGLALEWVGAQAEAWVRADGRRLEQVVENLLVNALRYVPSGGTVRLGLERAAGGGRHRLTVSDDGPGIAPEDLPHVFERFYRADAARAQGGTGLGLAIVREIVAQHGGAVRAGHAAPRGAAFVVELPGEGG